MDMLADQEILSEVSQDPYIRSHPLSRERVASFTRGAEFAYRDVEDTAEMRHRHKMAQAKIRGFLDHPSTTLRRYPSNNTDMPSRYARAIALHRQGQLSAALAEIDVLISQTPNSPWFHELKGQVNYEAGQAADGLAAYEKSVELAPDQPLLLIGLATTQLSVAESGGKMSQKFNLAAEKTYVRPYGLIRPIQPHIFSFPRLSAKCNVWPMLNGRWPSISPFWVGRRH